LHTEKYIKELHKRLKRAVQSAGNSTATQKAAVERQLETVKKLIENSQFP